MSLNELIQSKASVFDRHFSSMSHPLKDSIKNLVLVSDFAGRNIQLLRDLVSKDQCLTLLSREEYFSAVRQLSLDSAQAAFMTALRQFRTRHFLRLLLLELAGIASTEQIIQSWSDCADALIMHALAYCKQTLQQRFGVPINENGQEVVLYCLAMGKLGGRELNYSSDIDLIFTFSEAGFTDGKEQEANIHYFTKLIQQFVQLLQSLTVDGFVFRVDLRLRPNGDSGPLVQSLAALETYYQEQGRDWERYAMVKARVITEQVDDTPQWFERLIIPFVYRRYVDFSVIESLRSMKALIEREVQLNPRLDDIKRGKGGIREIEFIIQNFQLIRGGRLPQLRQANALLALAELKREQLLPRCEALKNAYLFLRRLENALQSLDDKQTHSLPGDTMKQAQISLAMGFENWEQLEKKLHQYQRIVSSSFGIALGKVEAYEDEKRLLANQLASLWQGHVEDNMAINLLSSLGYENAQQCYQMIHAFRHSPRCRRLPQGARMRLDRFMVLLLTELMQVPKTDEVLLQVMHLLENIVGRSAYLALLTENPHTVHEVMSLMANSPFISSLLASQPFLLEVLLDQQQAWKPLSVNQLRKQLLEQLSHADDVEMQENILRQFKSIHWLMAARAELYGTCHSVRIGQFLSDLAEVIVIQVLELACQQLSVRYPEMRAIKSRFAIIAYGKLGSREMNFNSDLDLVFLHTAKTSEEALVTRLTQKIVHMLTTRSQSGVLYPVDTRLRPSGAAGLMVSHVDAFILYQKNQAWTWEHQALLKARMIAGTKRIQHIFQEVKEAVIGTVRDKAQLQQDIVAMRAKVDQYQELDAIKHAPGGLLDLEFLVQFLVLNLGNPYLAKYTHTLNQMQHLFLAQVLTKQQYTILKKAYSHYHQLLHQNVVRPEKVANKKLQEAVFNVCRELYQVPHTER